MKDYFCISCTDFQDAKDMSKRLIDKGHTKIEIVEDNNQHESRFRYKVIYSRVIHNELKI